GRDDGHRVVRGDRGWGHGQPDRRRGRRPPHGAGGRAHHVLRPRARRDHGVHRHGGPVARAPLRALRRARPPRVAGRPAMRSIAAWIGAHSVASFIAFFAVFPFLVPYQSLATQVLIFGLFALGFNLLYGYTGLLSFGHAAYYGLGAYGTGIALAKLKLTSLWLALGVGLGAAVVGGARLAFFSLRRRGGGISSAMLTLACAQMLYFAAFPAADLTGGDDGLRGIPLHALWLPGGSFSLRNPLAFYFFAYVLVVLAVAGLKRILDSPFGA